MDYQDYIESNLEKAKPVAAHSGASEWTANCPGCGRSSKFYVNATSGRFFCNSCHIRGNSFAALIAIVEDVSITEARRRMMSAAPPRRKTELFNLADRIRALRPDAVTAATETLPPVHAPLPDGFQACYSARRKHPWSLPAYLKKRRIRSNTARRWGMGWCRAGNYAGRLVIPISCPNGESWTARAMSDDVWGPKYLNPVADHARLLIGWNMVRDWSEPIILVEGPLDAVAMWQHGYNALAISGNVMKPPQVELLMGLDADTLFVVMLDPEEESAPFDVAGPLLDKFRVKLAKLPTGVDPGDSTADDAREALDGAVFWNGERLVRLAGRIKNIKNSNSKAYSQLD